MTSREWIMVRHDYFYMIKPSAKCTPKDHADLNPDVIKIIDVETLETLWERTIQ